MSEASHGIGSESVHTCSTAAASTLEICVRRCGQEANMAWHEVEPCAILSRETIPEDMQYFQ